MQFSPEVWVFRVKGTEVGSAGIQEAQLQDVQEYFGVNWQEALQYHGGNNSGCPLEMLKLSFILNFFSTPPNLCTKDLTLIGIHMV